MNIDLSGKVALITGAESGIGKAIAIEFAKLGCHLILTYYHDENLGEQTLKEVEKHGNKNLLIQADVSKQQEVEKLFETAVKTFNQINFLVNSAGVRSVDKPLSKMSSIEFDHAIQTNLYSVFHCCKCFLKHYSNHQQEGRIINITSVQSKVVSAGKTDYCSSKFAVKGFSEALSLELAPQKITVNCIAPGMILTPMNQRAIDEPIYREELEKRIPLQYAGLPEDVANAAVFLVSDYARYITGTTQVVDGGLMLNRTKGAK